MQDLRLIGVHEDGQHLLLAGTDGTRYRVALDEPLRAAARRDRPRPGQLAMEIDGGLRPRDVQALIRGGASAEEAADRAGWTVDKVRRYEGPILAEREHMAGLARAVHLRARSGSGGSGPSGASSAPTLAARVAQRLSGRGVQPDFASWDAFRTEGGPWTVVVTFPAGGRERQASWQFDPADRTVSALDDEARWLSEEEKAEAGPLPAATPAPVERTTTVYDVEAAGDVTTSVSGSRHTEPLDLMSAMRQRSTARVRRGRRGTKGGAHPSIGSEPIEQDQALPLEAHDAYDADDPSAGSVLAGGSSPGGSSAGGSSAGGSSAVQVDDEPQVSSGAIPSGQSSPSRSGTVEDEPEDSSKAPRRGARRGGRTSVPSWDDIMFGARPGSDKQ